MHSYNLQVQTHHHSFVIQVANYSDQTFEPTTTGTSTTTTTKLNLSAMKLFNRFRKILMRLIFSLPPRGSCSSSSSSATPGMTPRQRNCDRSFDPPKTSCSSYYSSHSHYNEAIADCIEFFNKSSQEGGLDGRKSSDIMV
ncbi:uncharacterized protein LOC107408298 [Ziziphus jujuba]|uniref:Uncharacterized protein LOC107408298 n=2 Tax=Ziziphus jujuba TaxID=326968 RepID=A0A6P6FUZ0_ZIZJJ|nr:uncharacterized protein LOC107408298 [Ziziphus jujuba]KAH7523516.1 hypothetical protein FEM48_Zijuj06G0019700 [Ziziphus jujuba var. spinosa]